MSTTGSRRRRNRGKAGASDGEDGAAAAGGASAPSTPAGRGTRSGDSNGSAGNGKSGHDSRPTTSPQVESLVAAVQALQSDIRKLRENDDDASRALGDAERRLRDVKAEAITAFEDRMVRMRENMEQEIEQATDAVRATLEGVSLWPRADDDDGGGAQRPAVGDVSRLWSEKRFSVRASMLTKMLHNKDFQTIYHIAVTVMLWLGVNIVVEDIFRGREWYTGLDLDMFWWAFGKADVVMYAWMAMFAAGCVIIPIVLGIHRSSRGDGKTAPPLLWVLPYAALQTSFWVFAVHKCFNEALPPASGLIIMCECSRISMKMHAYIREKVLYGMMPQSRLARFVPDWAARRGVKEADIHAPEIDVGDFSTEFGRYMYFMFAPTLVYRDTYPRARKTVRWTAVITHGLNALACVAYTFVIFRSLCAPQFRETADKPGDLQTFTISVFRSMIPGMLVLFLAFFGVLHSWFNMFAELLTFGDRRFYVDWWTAKSFAVYYRKWNIVVHEFLYYYVYNDTMRFSGGRVGKNFAALWVFVISALAHEAILAAGLGFVFPVLLLMFGGPGVIFTKFKRSEARFFNVFMWAMLSVGQGLLMVLYSREYYARAAGRYEASVPQHPLGFMYPRSLIAYRLEHGGAGMA